MWQKRQFFQILLALARVNTTLMKYLQNKGVRYIAGPTHLWLNTSLVRLLFINFREFWSISLICENEYSQTFYGIALWQKYILAKNYYT